MAVLNADNYAKAYVNEPLDRVDVSHFQGRVRRFYEEITLAAELTAADTILLLKLPKGARVIEGRIVKASDGTAGQLSWGWQSNGTDAADPNGFFDGPTEVDFGSGAISARMSTASAGWNKKFAAETQVECLVDETSIASVGDTFQFELLYVVD